MPYDITDAKEDISVLNANQQYIMEMLRKKGIIPKDKEVK